MNLAKTPSKQDSLDSISSLSHRKDPDLCSGEVWAGGREGEKGKKKRKKRWFGEMNAAPVRSQQAVPTTAAQWSHSGLFHSSLDTKDILQPI